VLSNKGLPAALIYGTILALYFLLSYPLSRLGKRLESRLAASGNR
jgi:polar amino acid transport system permease protein